MLFENAYKKIIVSAKLYSVFAFFYAIYRCIKCWKIWSETEIHLYLFKGIHYLFVDTLLGWLIAIFVIMLAEAAESIEEIRQTNLKMLYTIKQLHTNTPRESAKKEMPPENNDKPNTVISDNECFCCKCGKKQPKGYTFCHYCGNEMILRTDKPT